MQYQMNLYGNTCEFVHCYINDPEVQCAMLYGKDLMRLDQEV